MKLESRDMTDAFKGLFALLEGKIDAQQEQMNQQYAQLTQQISAQNGILLQLAAAQKINAGTAIPQTATAAQASHGVPAQTAAAQIPQEAHDGAAAAAINVKKMAEPLPCAKPK